MFIVWNCVCRMLYSLLWQARGFAVLGPYEQLHTVEQQRGLARNAKDLFVFGLCRRLHKKGLQNIWAQRYRKPHGNPPGIPGQISPLKPVSILPEDTHEHRFMEHPPITCHPPLVTFPFVFAPRVPSTVSIPHAFTVHRELTKNTVAVFFLFCAQLLRYVVRCRPMPGRIRRVGSICVVASFGQRTRRLGLKCLQERLRARILGFHFFSHLKCAG